MEIVIIGNSLQQEESQRKFGTARELLVLPSFEIAINRHPWIPLGYGIKVIAIFRKKFVTASSTYFSFVIYFIIPVDLKN